MRPRVGSASALRARCGGWTLTCASGQTAAKQRGGDRRSGRIEAQADLLLGAIEQTPDITLAELRERLIKERGEAFAISTIHDFYRRRGVTYKKKTAHASEQEREDVKARREAWFDLQPELDPEKLVFLDETGATTKMARLRGRSPRGERCRAAVPHGHWKTTTLVAALRLDGLAAPMVIDGAMNGEAFTAYAETLLAPTLRPGDIVIMDNLPAHKVSGARAAIERAGARLLFLPPYSRISTRSNRPSPRSRRSCERLRRGRSRPSTPPSPRRWTPSHPTNAPTTSPTRATSQIEPKML